MRGRQTEARAASPWGRRAAVLAVAVAVAFLAAYWRLRAPAPPFSADRAGGHGAPVSGGDAMQPLPPLGAGTPPPRECDDGAQRRDGQPDEIARRERASARALDAVAAELAAHPAAADRALAELVRFVNSLSAATEKMTQQDPPCARDPTCAAAQDAALAQAARPHRDALADIAAGSNDAGAYALAYMTCNMGYPAGDPGKCAQVSARQWAQIEPDNAQPWLFVASEAAQHEAPAQVADALFRASQARRNDLHWDLFAHLLDSEALQGQSGEVRSDVTRTIMAMAVGGRFAPLSPVLSHCTAAALTDPNRRQVCEDLARLLTERSDTLAALAVGTALGERLGWPAARLESLRDWRAAFDYLASERAGADSFSCESQAKQREWFNQTLRNGELGALRRAVAASGQTAARLARQRREAAGNTGP